MMAHVWSVLHRCGCHLTAFGVAILLGSLVMPAAALAQAAAQVPGQSGGSGVPRLSSAQSITIDRRSGRQHVYGWYSCLEIETRAGEYWMISATHVQRTRSYPDLRITARKTCEFPSQPEFDTTPAAMQDGTETMRHHFVAGGGPYRIIVSASSYARSIVLSAQAREPDLNMGGRVASRSELHAAETYDREVSSPTASTSTGAIRMARPPGERFRDCAICPEMVVIPAGNFMMGSLGSEEGRNSDEGPLHQVTFNRSFAMGRTEVTADEWQACVADRACTHPALTSSNGRRPVVAIIWSMARTYADWLSSKTGQRYFLPSEAEWEYAARAGTTTPWNTGDAIITDDANILNQFKQPVPAGGFPPNAFGLHDMHGNVAEWVLDCHDVGYFGAPADGGAVVTPNCANRVVRGGSFANNPAFARSASRYRQFHGTPNSGIGFRVARAM